MSGSKCINKIFLFGLTVVLAGSGLITACSKEVEKKLANEDIFLYQGPDRDQKVIDQARQEGVVSIYTSMTLIDWEQIARAFERKYDIKTKVRRAGAGKIVYGAMTEAKAGRHEVDVFELLGPPIEKLYREKLLAEFYSPELTNLIPQALPKHRHYVMDRLNLFVLAYNTQHVKPAEVPKSYEDLLNPKWLNRLAMEPTDVDWFASVVKGTGEEKGLNFFKKLAAQQPKMMEGHTLLVQRTASGEAVMALNAFSQGVEQLKKKDATIAWKVLPPVIAGANGLGIAKNAPHPYAALLLVDFVLSKEGQEILRGNDRVTVNRLVASPLTGLDYEIVDPTLVLDEWDKWSTLWSNLFLGGKKVTKDE
jgi:iron(III) transport system substrate-binding protein